MLKAHVRGFTLVELMVGLTVIAILASIAAPAFRSVVENSRIRGASKSIESGIALARAEAVRLNTRIEFVLLAGGWNVRQVSDGAVLHQSAGAEGAGSGLTVNPTPGGADRITYDAFGRRVANNPSDGSAPLSQLDIVATNPSGSSNYRPMRVQLLAGGMSRLCEPLAAGTEPKACL